MLTTSWDALFAAVDVSAPFLKSNEKETLPAVHFDLRLHRGQLLGYLHFLQCLVHLLDFLLDAQHVSIRYPVTLRSAALAQ